MYFPERKSRQFFGTKYFFENDFCSYNYLFKIRPSKAKSSKCRFSKAISQKRFVFFIKIERMLLLNFVLASKMAINIHGLPYNDFNSNISTIEVHDVDELEIVAETSIGLHVGFAENATK